MYDSDSINKIFMEEFYLPPDMVFLYSRFWQLETWLRQIIYIETKSLKNDWKSFFPKLKNQEALTKDKRLTHMLTPQENPLSYITFGELWEIIKRNDLWDCFSPYLPPKDILEAKLKEIFQIRHRVAHFRTPHTDDLCRTIQFLRDLDEFFWKFCTSYNNTISPRDRKSNVLIKNLSHIDQSVVRVYIELSIRPWVNLKNFNSLPISEPGILYYVRFVATDSRKFDYDAILKFSKNLHIHCIHIMLDRVCSFLTITFPSITALNTIEDTILNFYEIAKNSAWKQLVDKDEAEKVAAKWAEYVLPPSNPLTFLWPDMPCSFFGV